MNERIKGFVKSVLEQSDTNTDELTVFNNNELEKFTELIIDECCLKLLSMHDKVKSNHNYYGHAALEIRKHFTIEK